MTRRMVSREGLTVRSRSTHLRPCCHTNTLENKRGSQSCVQSCSTAHLTLKPIRSSSRYMAGDVHGSRQGSVQGCIGIRAIRDIPFAWSPPVPCEWLQSGRQTGNHRSAQSSRGSAAVLYMDAMLTHKHQPDEEVMVKACRNRHSCSRLALGGSPLCLVG